MQTLHNFGRGSFYSVAIFASPHSIFFSFCARARVVRFVYAVSIRIRFSLRLLQLLNAVRLMFAKSIRSQCQSNK